MSKRQDCTACASTHAELIAASTVANEVVWHRGLLDELGLPQHSPTVIYMDNAAVYSLSRDFASNAKSRHIERRHFIVRGYQHRGAINTRQIPTANNWADLFTKLHTRVPFEKFTRAIMNLARLSIAVVQPRAVRFSEGTKLQRPVYGSHAAGRIWK